MIETGAISDKEDFKNIIEVYKDDYNALATIKNLLGTDKDKLELHTLIPKDNRQYNKKALNDLRNNIENNINPFNTKDPLTLNSVPSENFIIANFPLSFINAFFIFSNLLLLIIYIFLQLLNLLF